MMTPLDCSYGSGDEAVCAGDQPDKLLNLANWFFGLRQLDDCLGSDKTQCLPFLIQALAHIRANRLPGDCPRNSFAGATPVLMADGSSKPIEDVKVGDKIANSLPGEDQGIRDQTHTVTAVHITHTDRDYTDVSLDTSNGLATITGTAHHLYWDATTRAWTRADLLHVGDRLQTSAGHSAIIRALRNHTASITTYNLTIDGLHTYYVEAGDTPVLVHNGCDDVALGPGVSSANTLNSFASAKPETEFVFDAERNQFLAGDREPIPGGLSPHEQLAESLGADKNSVLGGTIFRDNGRLVFTENSGHYGHRWTDATRQQFQEFLNGYGVEYDYRPWG